MNKQLVYKSSRKKLGFVDGISQNFSNNMTPTFYNESVGTAEMKKDYVFTTANDCRWWYEPIFSNESKYLPVKQEVQSLPQGGVANDITIQDLTQQPFDTKEELTIPPQEKQENMLVNALMVGLVAAVVFKILT